MKIILTLLLLTASTHLVAQKSVYTFDSVYLIINGDNNGWSESGGIITLDGSTVTIIMSGSGTKTVFYTYGDFEEDSGWDKTAKMSFEMNLWNAIDDEGNELIFTVKIFKDDTTQFAIYYDDDNLALFELKQ